MDAKKGKTELLTTGQVAEYCQVTHRAVLKWVEAGKLKAFRTPGKHSRVTVEDFLQFLHEYKMPIPEDLKPLVSQKKILIVDDDRGMVRSIQRVLMLENKYLIEVAFDGFEAGKKFSAFKPDFIILDIHMPGLNGYQVCASIRQDLNNKDVKILVISATNDPQQIQKIKDLGADDYLEKPFSNDALNEKVQRLVSA